MATTYILTVILSLLNGTTASITQEYSDKAACTNAGREVQIQAMERDSRIVVLMCSAK